VVVELDGPLEVATVEIDDKEVSFSPDGTDKRLTFKVDPGNHKLPVEDIGPSKVPALTENDSTATGTLPRPEYDPLSLPKLGLREPVAKANVILPLPLSDPSKMAGGSLSSPKPITPEPKPNDTPQKNVATLAPLELRTQERRSDLPKYVNTLRGGQPLGEFAAVSNPGKVNDIISWSIEPVLHRGSFRSIDIRDDGTIVTGGNDGALRIWTSEWKLIKVLPGHANSVVSVEFSPDGRTLASVSSGLRDMLAVWDVDSGQLLKFHHVSNWQGHLAWSPDGKYILHAGVQNLELIEPLTGQKMAADNTDNKYRLGRTVAFSPDGDRFVTEGEAGNVHVFQTESLKVLKDFAGGTAQSVDWSGDGKWIALGGSTVKIVDTRSFQTRQTLEAVGSARFSPRQHGDCCHCEWKSNGL